MGGLGQIEATLTLNFGISYFINYGRFGSAKCDTKEWEGGSELVTSMALSIALDVLRT